MDERKWTIKSIIKSLFLGGLGLILAMGVYGGLVYLQTQTIKDPKKCFTTAMYKVKLCPSSPDYVRYKQVPKHFFQSLILSEDAAFYSHKGFDWFEIKESFRRNIIEWKFARGGSTLTQQLAKNLYLTPEKSLSRKFKEFFIAKQIEKKLSKWQILEKYINVVEFGKNIFGTKMASNHYFGKSPAQLNHLESIYLVSLLPSPKRLGRSFEKKTLSKSNKWRMKIILERMYRTKKISDAMYVYYKMLIETEAWPFNEASQEFFDGDLMSVEDEMFLEFEKEPNSNDENDVEIEVEVENEGEGETEIESDDQGEKVSEGPLEEDDYFHPPDENEELQPESEFEEE